jgi:hypothetical protein
MDAIIICGSVSLAQDSIVYGPAWFGNNTMVGVKNAVLDLKRAVMLSYGLVAL